MLAPSLALRAGEQAGTSPTRELVNLRKAGMLQWLSAARTILRQRFMDKLLAVEMQATLRALQLVGSVLECDAEGCHGEAKGELMRLISNLRSGRPEFELDGYQAIANQAQAALDVHDTRQRIWLTAKLHIALWEKVITFLDA